MLKAYRVGRISGVDINVHPTFGLVVLLAILQWATGDDRSLLKLILGLLLVMLIFVSVLVHELGHCAMAQQFGIKVLDVTLWPFGGVARIEQMPAQPKAELLISMAGPAMNLAIAVSLLPIILLIGILFGRDSLFTGADFFTSITFASLLTYWALTNVLIMLFNVLPAFPVDGGRMFRAALTPAIGRAQATSIAVTFGLALAILMIALGIWMWNPILPLLGIFIVFAARAEARVERVQSAMRRLRVGQYALWDMGGISPDKPLTFALRGGPRDVVVTERGQVVGMLWRTDLLDGLLGGVASHTVGDMMDRSVVVASTNDSIYDVQQQMTRANRQAIPVTEDGMYRGIFTAERFVHLYRQIAPGLLTGKTISDEWKEAISVTLSFGKRRH